jgi:hypothetical protein
MGPNKTRDKTMKAGYMKREATKMTASAFTALGYEFRTLDFIDSFHGHACSWCECRFPETKPNLPKKLTSREKRRRLAVHRKKQFDAHGCVK